MQLKWDIWEFIENFKGSDKNDVWLDSGGGGRATYRLITAKKHDV